MNKSDHLLVAEGASNDDSNKVTSTHLESNPLIITNGIAVIINNDTFTSEEKAKKLPYRTEAKVDVQSLEKVLVKFNFEVLIWDNKNYKDLEIGLNNLAKKDHSKNDCLLVFVMTYAIDDSPFIYAQDKKYEVEQIWNQFGANKSLINKPKIFVIHAPSSMVKHVSARTNKVTNTDARGFSCLPNLIPSHTNFLITFNSYGGYKDENPYEGSLFIQSLCNVLMTHDHSTTNVLKIMTCVTKLIKNNSSHEQKQVPATQTTLIQQIHFKPQIVSTKPIIINNTRISEEYPQKESLSPTSTTIKKDVKSEIYVTKDASCYKMDHERRGYAVLIINDHFVGDASKLPVRDSLKDVQYLQTILNHLKFEILIWDNFCRYEIVNSLTELAKEDHTANDCLVFFVMTHGYIDSIYAKDERYHVDFLWKRFSDDKCPSLAGKPKLFFIQACRGGKSDIGIQLNREQNTKVDNSSFCFKLPTQHPDFLIAFSSCDGYVSFNNTWYGSWFIRSLCFEMENNNLTTTDIFSLMPHVSRSVASYKSRHLDDPLKKYLKQLPVTHSTLIGNVYLNDKKKELPPHPKTYYETYVSLTSQKLKNILKGTEKEDKIINLNPINSYTTSDAIKSGYTTQIPTEDAINDDNYKLKDVKLQIPLISQKELDVLLEMMSNVKVNVTIDNKSAGTFSIPSKHSIQTNEEN